MEQNAPRVKDIQAYHNHFRKVAENIRFQPRSQRSCNDKFCFLFFFIFTAIFLGFGIYFIKTSQIKTIVAQALKAQDISNYIQVSKKFSPISFENLRSAIPILSAMMLFTLVMAILFLCLLVRFPKCIFIVMLILGILLLSTITIYLFMMKSLIPAIILCAIILILVCIIGCSYKKIKTGIVLVHVASKFLSEKPSTFLAPIFLLVFILSFQMFWGLTFAGISVYNLKGKNETEINHQKQINYVIAFFWTLFNLFYPFFFYYCISFLIATSSGIWYYNLNDNYIVKGVSRIIRYHIGSFTFASMLLFFVSLARQSTSQQSRGGCNMGTCFICLCACCFTFLEDLLQTLNHNSIITMSLTGESYLESAKSTLSLIYQNFGLFYLIDLMSNLITVAGVIFICGVPSVVGFFLLKSTSPNPDDINSLTVGTIIIILFGMIIGGIFLSVLSQSLSCMYIIFCLDKKFIQYGYPGSQNAPKQIRQIFEQLSPYVGGQYNENLDVRKIKNEEQQQFS